MSKPVSWKTYKHLFLATTIKELGFLIMACSFYKRYGMGDYYKIIDGITRYKECMHYGGSYDRTGVLLSACELFFFFFFF
jgi:hypothetical protein